MPGTGGRLFPHKLIAVLCFFLLARDAASQQPDRRPGPPLAAPDDLNLIVSYVTVTASKGVAPRLSASDFHILEDNTEQRIDYFSIQDQPASVGVLWGAGTGFDEPPPDRDVSECPREFMRNMAAGSEYFFLAADTVTIPYTSDIVRFPRVSAWSGSSSDNVYIGLDVLKEAANSRRILLVVTTPSGGGGGQLDPKRVERAASKLGYQVHVVSFTRGADDVPNHEGAIFLKEVADLSGGSYSLGVISNVLCPNLARELRVQYLIGYRPTNTARDGKWRKLSVSVESPEGGPRLKASIRRGYYAPRESE